MKVSTAILPAVVLGAALGTALPACRPAPADGHAGAPTLTLAPCRLELLGEPARCGSYEVFEDRAAGTGRRISLKVVVVPARGTPRPDPLFLLAGGPGQSITEVGPILVRALDDVRRNRDIVLVDQRGTGGSNPLRCAEGEADLARYFRTDVLLAADVERCLGSLQADPRLYTTDLAVDDFDEVRAALGYERINLWGGSYGTRAALVYLRRHPQRIRAAVLDGVAPPSLPIPLEAARDAERALGLLLEACAGDAACHAAFPGLRADIQSLLERLAQAPPTVTLPHPRSGEPATVTITREAFAGGLRALLYSADAASLLPLMVKDALAGRFEPFVAATASVAESTEQWMSIGTTLSVLCAEDLPRLGPDAAAGAADGTFLGLAMVQAFRDACALWPHGQAPPDFGAPVVSDVPVLLLSGDLDPVTPPRWGEEAARHLARSRHVVVKGAAHGVTTLGCAGDRIAEFLEQADATGLDLACLDSIGRAPFFVSFAGPVP